MKHRDPDVLAQYWRLYLLGAGMLVINDIAKRLIFHLR